ncbi:hypothetical protein HBH92_146810 [Parastagonospora nodorum]|nr:hypothetical protein HBH92_146810 [Parastagonospora nodorum]KAH4435665.1 hypothetical protein HBH93_116340 [Parastagonospora nodorum]KAH4447426.1 hypothetical protein HBH91_136500 [Parastagonospora nodorum]KAH4505582.1 hypothetical protein HBH89_085750 [Parastagonospora nodorum]KAH4537157.1 hypothetical protein HBH85_151300 [Parastagonospora nodorum]
MLPAVILALTTLSAAAAAAKCRSDQPRCPNENTCTTTTGNGAVFQMKCATDYNGIIIQSTQAGSYADCASACAWVTGCKAFNYKGEFCYLLGDSLGTARTSDSVAAGVMTTAGTTTSSSSNACSEVVDCDVPGTNDCTYTTAAGTFKTSCDTDFYGNDIGITSADNLSQCMKNCAGTTGCKAVSWSTGTCYLKSIGSNGIFSQWVDAAAMA